MNNEGLEKLFVEFATVRHLTSRSNLTLDIDQFGNFCQSPELREMVVGTCECGDSGIVGTDYTFNEDGYVLVSLYEYSKMTNKWKKEINLFKYCFDCGGKISQPIKEEAK